MNLPVYIREGKISHAEIVRYPDGQRNLILDMSYYNDCKVPILIKCSIRKFDELELLAMTVAALKRHDFVIEKIEFKYLFGMRSDRSFQPGMPNYFRDVVAPIIKLLTANYHTEIYVPHSDISMRVFDNSSIEDTPFLFCEDFYKGKIAIAADESAFRKYSHDAIGYFNKKRISNDNIMISASEIIKHHIKKQDATTPILIIDDLCDGGLTFIRIAEYLEEHYPTHPRYLYVTHGLFTKGVDHVAKHYTKVITTNSYQDFASERGNPKLEVIDVWSS